MVPEVLRRFQQRPEDEQLSRRQMAVQHWRKLAASEPEGIQRKVVEQVVLLLDLEAELARRAQGSEVPS
jgi:DNA-directed RNA polymerase subunit F